LPFYIIINPDSGPVTNPSKGYQTCIPKLKAASSNVIVVGYVLTGFGSRSADDINTDVGTYAAWGSAYRPQGIFFDEINPTAKLLSKYTTVANNARATLNGGSGYVRVALLACMGVLSNRRWFTRLS
jgi:hypothetical protein